MNDKDLLRPPLEVRNAELDAPIY